MSYIDGVALAIYQASDPGSGVDVAWLPLYRIYAVLALSKGLSTTARDVHDAWSAFMCGFNPEHRSLVPFEDLIEAVQRLDDVYVEAIHSVARDLVTQ